VKSFSVSSIAADPGEMHSLAQAAVSKNPQALFTDFQWYLFKSQNTVYFTAYSETSYDKEGLITFVGNMVTLAPQLTHGFKGATPGAPLPRHLLEAITTIEEVDEFDAEPDRWFEPGQELFEPKDLPLFRVKAIVRRGGADAQGRAAMILVRSSHALMEGSDSALLTRSLSSHHGVIPKTGKLPLRERLKFGLIASFTAPLHLLMANLRAPSKDTMGFRSLSFPRPRLRRIANKLGVSQRALMFGAVLYAVNDDGKGFAEDKIKSYYTTLDSDRLDTDDEFFRVRTINTEFDVIKDLPEFLRHVEERIMEVEKTDTSKMQMVMNATFKAHRMLSKVFPFFYKERFFRYNGEAAVVLTLVPPHRMYGNLTRGLKEPVYCGSYHPGTNLCTFCPGRDYVTFNFSMRERHLPNADKVLDILEALDAE